MTNNWKRGGVGAKRLGRETGKGRPKKRGRGSKGIGGIE